MRTLRLLLLSLVSCFGLFPLNHAAAHNAVKTPQVEEGDGPKQPHGDNLQRFTSEGHSIEHTAEVLWSFVSSCTCWRPSVMEVTGDIPQVRADSM